MLTRAVRWPFLTAILIDVPAETMPKRCTPTVRPLQCDPDLMRSTLALHENANTPSGRAKVSSELLRTRRDLVGDQIVVHVIGEIDLATAPQLDQELSEAAAAPGAQSVVVNLTQVGFLGAAGLTVLLAATRAGGEAGVPVVVVTSPGQPPHRTIITARLHTILALIDSLDQAGVGCTENGNKSVAQSMRG